MSEAFTSYKGSNTKRDTSERDQIAQRMRGDSVTIGGPARSISKDTTNRAYH